MYINNINILYYLLVGLIGLAVGQFSSWCVLRMPDYKKVFVREFFTIYLNCVYLYFIYFILILYYLLLYDLYWLY